MDPIALEMMPPTVGTLAGVGVDAWIAAVLLSLVGVAHSVLGEQAILQPLFAGRLRDRSEGTGPHDRSDGAPKGISVWAQRRILRFGWHLTTVAWWALAASMIGLPPALAVAATCAISAAIIVILLPGHLAWPIFTAAGLGALHSYGALPSAALVIVGAVGVAVLVLVGLLHIAWAWGLTWGSDVVLPQGREGAPVFTPGRGLTALVALAMFAAAALQARVLQGDAPMAVQMMVGLAGVAFALRAVGDFKLLGFTKTIRSTRFARLDDQVYTPLVVLLAFASATTLLVA